MRGFRVCVKRDVRSAALGDRKDFNVVLSQEGRAKNPALLIFLGPPFNQATQKEHLRWPQKSAKSTARQTRNRSEDGAERRKVRAIIGRGMLGRGISLKSLLPIPLPIIPLPNLHENE
jgi:hypothetical protein